MPLISRAFDKLNPSSRKTSFGVDDKAKHLANGLITNGTPRSSTSSPTSDALNADGQPLSRNQTKKKSKRKGDHKRKVSHEQQSAEEKQRRRASDDLAWGQEPEEIKSRYGDLPFVQSQERKHDQRMQLKDVSLEDLGQEVTFRCRVHATRKMSARLAFIVLRQQLDTVQGILHQKDGYISTHMVQWAERIPNGSIVVCKGTVQRPEQEIKNCSKRDIEIVIQDLHVVARRPEQIPFTVYEDETSKEKELLGEEAHITDRARLAHRIIDLRTSTSKSIFRIVSGVGNLFRSYLDSQGFIEIHTPKLQGGATESGSSVFQVDYFDRPAFLAQSPQLAKQMAIAADLEKVYEVGPVFRAENSNTHRHLTEYTGLDLEMAIQEHYHEALEMIDGTLKHIFKGIYEKFGNELAFVKKHFPHEDLVWLNQTPRISFKDGIQMLIDSGWTDEHGTPPSPYEDLHTRDEIRLGELIKEIYHTDYYILDKFPASARPFYTMPDPQDPNFTNSFDLFLRGQEILTGGQRIHGVDMLEKRMKEQGVDPSSMENYMDGFRYAAPPHAGAGIGLERIVMLMLQLGNIRFASLFYRDPKSLPARSEGPKLRHLDDNTLHPPWEEFSRNDQKRFQPLENLIANYGDATNTSWTDDRNQIWRHNETGAAVSWVPVHGYAIVPGNPLCDPTQYTQVANAFLSWLKRNESTRHLKPIWLLVGYEFEEVLGAKFGWKTFTCAAEERIDASKNDAEKEHEVARKMRHAEKEGIWIKEFDEGEPIPDDLRVKADNRIEEWKASRVGRKQIHITEVTPWRDPAHRRYFFALDKGNNVHAMAVLAQLSLPHGYQVKYTLDFPGAPSGTIEYIILKAIRAAKESGTKSLTFGGAASSKLHAVHHLGGMRVRMLQRTYRSIVKEFKLTQKSDFRQKLGGVEDPIYVCYPPGGLGVSGARAVVGYFESDH
ncbi:hypothetical protein MMC21_005998 [Puttea exsequens]|nr:hypothetical protein [Puttea exsequens]